MDINEHGWLHGDYFTLTVDAARDWGCYEAKGKEAADGGTFRHRLINALYDYVVESGERYLEVYAPGYPVGAPDWIVTVIEPGFDYEDLL